jgi:uncharacterized protein (TIGR02145 family)
MNFKPIFVFFFSILIVLLALISGCKEDETTQPILTPNIQTLKASGITQTTATTGGYVTSDGGSTVIARGVCWSTNNNPTLNDNKTSDGEGVGNYSSNLSGLALNTTYYVSAYATNKAGTSYGKAVSFKTSSSTIPSVALINVTDITQTSVVCNGNITSDGFAPPVIERGICWSVIGYPQIAINKVQCGSGTGTYSIKITGLASNTAYCVRGYAINSAGLAYGYVIDIKTLHDLREPDATMLQISMITRSTAMAEGRITNANYGTITERGFCWNTTGSPTINDNKSINGTGLGRFSHFLNTLKENTTYYIRSYAINEVGAGYSEVSSFKTSWKSDVTIPDIDGNTYHTITIGNQVWMIENLKTTRYRNGDAIPNITDQTSWANLRTGAYCDYGNNSNNYQIYGRLYNWYAVNDSRKLAPEGWHIATYEDWLDLINYLGGSDIAGGKLKEAGLEHWLNPNTDATDETGFTALPGGERNFSSNFNNNTYYGFWWCSSESDVNTALNLKLYYRSGTILTNIDVKVNGYSIRCIKDK